jgi:hypothetical protein
MASMLKKLVPKMAAGARNASTLRKVRAATAAAHVSLATTRRTATRALREPRG